MADLLRDSMQDRNPTLDETLRNIRPDSTATFDNSPSNPTEHASSEATNPATALVGDDEFLEDEDDEAALDEADDEENEGEDVEDEAAVNSRGPAR